jgi:hypothetical protein
MTERGPLQSFELTWSSGHVETIKAHQVSYQGNSPMFGDPGRKARIDFHGEIDGHWMLILSALEDDLARIRNTTQTEVIL